MHYCKITYLFLLFTTLSFSQITDLSGTVVDETGMPLPGVNIIVQNTNNGTNSDFDGNFVLKGVPVTAKVEFSFIGFESLTYTVGSIPSTIIMKESTEALNEVVVIGYGVQKKKEVTGAVGSISSETIEALKPTRIEQALQGQVAGVQISANSGAPGSSSTIQIRGVSTNGDSRPLILVDGAVIEDLSVINPNDIESVDILKDATAGIYGVRAANGVIIITTKGGRKEMPTQFEYDGFGGFQTTTRKIPVLNATEYALLVNEAFAANGQEAPYTDVSALGQGTDWQDLVFESAPIQSHSYTVKGGGKKTAFAAGQSYLRQDGIVGGGLSAFSRMTSRGKFDYDITKNLKLTSGLLFTYTNRRGLPENSNGSILYNALNMAPTMTVFDDLGEYTLAEGLGNEIVNPIALMNNTFNRTKVNKLSGNFGLSYKFFDKITATAKYQFNYADVGTKGFSPLVWYGNGKFYNTYTDATRTDGNSSLTLRKDYYRDYTFDAYFEYNDTFGEDHNLKLLAGTSVFKTTGFFTGNTGTYFFDENINFNNATLDNADLVQNSYEFGGNTFDTRLLSYFGRLQYNYKEKYILSAVVRRDGSTAFGPENKFGVFPSGSLGWVVSEEPFLADSDVISFLKIRSSYGILGNDRIPANRFVSALTGEAAYVFPMDPANEIVFGIAAGPIANPEIKWEKQKAFDIGFDLNLFKNRIDITADYFRRRTEDLLVQPQVSGLLGVSAPGAAAPFVNAGTVENKGLEFAIGYNDRIGDNFKFKINYNITAIENNVLSVSGGNSFLTAGGFGNASVPIARMEVGHSIGYFRGYKTDGLFQTQDEIDNYATMDNTTFSPGDVKFVDINNDGEINEDDKVEVGKPLPDLTMGLNLSFSYKKFDFGAYAFASLGNDIVRSYERNQQLTNRTRYFLERWTGPGSTNFHPRVTTDANTNSLFSDFFIEDGSYLRLQNIQAGYTFEFDLDKSLRVYLSANNLLTLTNYRGYDPTISNGSPIGQGIDYGFYPNAKTFMLGLNLKL